MIKRLAPLLLSAALILLSPATGRSDHACDDLGQPGWSTIASHEVVDVKDGAPYLEPEPSVPSDYTLIAQFPETTTAASDAGRPAA